MNPSRQKGHVLIVTRDDERAALLTRWVRATGAEAVALSGAESKFLVEGNDESIEALVTDLDTADPQARSLLRGLASGDLFPGVPGIHLLRDAGFRLQLDDWNRDPSTTSMISPPDAGEFQARIRLAREIGRLRKESLLTAIGDPLTGLANRRYFLARLEQELSRSRRYRSPLSLILLDIDRLRAFNGRYGRPAGDAAIREVGDRVRRSVRKEDLGGRFGDECFAVMLPGTLYRGAAVLANKVRKETETMILPGYGHEPELRLSAGITCVQGNGERDLEKMLDRAEDALGEAKDRGGNRVYIDPALIRSDGGLVLVADPDRGLLKIAEDLLSLDDFKVALADSAPAAMETLRFQVPDLLIVDLQLGAEDRGRSFLEDVRELFPEHAFPVLATARSPESIPDNLAELGVDRLITKPFSASLLRDLARELIDG